MVKVPQKKQFRDKVNMGGKEESDRASRRP
jgi:hypothetical protein